MQLGGVHHITAVTSEAQSNLRFYAEVLGLRLVKKTVNQDDVSAYHLFYGDEIGRPGTEITFFDWPQFRIASNRAGTGEISAMELRVSDRTAIEYWRQRLEGSGVTVLDLEPRDGRAGISFEDPEGQRLRIIEDGDHPAVSGGMPWANSPVLVGHGVLGIGGVELTVESLAPTETVLIQVLGFKKVSEYVQGAARVALYEVGPGGPGAQVKAVERPNAPGARLGRGGVHHVAFRTPDNEEQAAWRERVQAAGLWVTPQIDRYYFKSIYFREPGGILIEIATDGPGFTNDEDVDHLGERLSLPPFLEGRREEIERRLTPLSDTGTALE